MTLDTLVITFCILLAVGIIDVVDAFADFLRGRGRR
jgi:hypothetical protein